MYTVHSPPGIPSEGGNAAVPFQKFHYFLAKCFSGTIQKRRFHLPTPENDPKESLTKYANRFLWLNSGVYVGENYS